MESTSSDQQGECLLRFQAFIVFENDEKAYFVHVDSSATISTL